MDKQIGRKAGKPKNNTEYKIKIQKHFNLVRMVISESEF